MPASIVDTKGVGQNKIDKKTESVCPYCGVGCQIEYNVKDNEIKYVNGIDGPANKNRLCVKGRFGFDYVSNPERLTKPLIRIKGKKKIYIRVLTSPIYMSILGRLHGMKH